LVCAPDVRAQDSTRSTLRVRHEGDAMMSDSLRWPLLRRTTYASPAAWLRVIVPTTTAQLRDQPEAWGPTGAGYGRRLALRITEVTTRDVIRIGLSRALDHDPRYQRCACRGVLPRAANALLGTVRLADANGALQFDPSAVAAAYGSGWLGAVQYPSTGRGLRNGWQLGTQSLAQMALGNVALEFAPDVRKWFRRKP
jgi:hypothetical protein